MSLKTCFKKLPGYSTAWPTQRHFTVLGSEVFIAEINVKVYDMQS